MMMQKDARDAYSLKSVAYNTIKKKILQGEIMPGERIREDVLAEKLDISRTPVREAMNRLVMDGLVNNVPRKGLYCVEITKQLIDDTCDLRMMVDTYAIRRCCGCLTDEQINYLFSLNHRMRTQLPPASFSSSAHMEFHTFFVHQAGNAMLMRVEAMYDAYLTMMFSLITRKDEATRNERSWDEHRRMVECVRDNLPDEAEKVCAMHVNKLRTDLYYELKKGNILHS